MSIAARFTADTTDFRRGLSEVQGNLTALTRSSKQLGGELTRSVNEFSGGNLVRRTETMARAIREVGGAGMLTQTELRRASAQLDEYTNKMGLMGQKVPADIAKLRTELGSLVTSGNAASQGLGSFGAAADRVLGRLGITVSQGIGVAAVGSLTALSAALAKGLADTIAYGGAISDIAVKAGVSAEAIQELKFAAEQSGNTVEQVTTALQRMSRNLTEGTKGTGEIVSSLGLSLRELQQMQPDAAFQVLARRIAEIPNPMQQAHAAMELFGRSGAELLPLLTSNLDEVRASARELGLVMSNDAVAGADALGDAIDRLRGSVDGLVRTSLTPAIPFLREFATGLEVFARAPGAALRTGLREMAADLERVAGLLPGGDAVQNATLAQIARPIVGPVAELANVGNPASAGMRALAAQLKEIAGPETKRDLDAVGGALFRISNAGAGVAGAGGEGGSGGGSGGGLDKLRSEIDKLTGAKTIEAAVTLADALAEIRLDRVASSELQRAVTDLVEARDRARELGPSFATSLAKIETALARLTNSSAYREFFRGGLVNPQIGVNGNLRNYGPAAGSAGTIGGLFGAFQPDIGRGVGLPIDRRNTGGRLGSLGYAYWQDGLSGGLGNLYSGGTVAGSIVPNLTAGLKVTRDWRLEVQGVARAFADLAQTAGPSLDGVTRVLGVSLSSANASQELLTALAKSFGYDKGGNFTGNFLMNAQGQLTSAGRAIGGGAAGLGAGVQVGSLFTNRGAGFVGGAAGGALAGSPFGPVGIGVGAIVGGFAGMFTAGANASNQRKAKDLQASQLVAQYGSLDKLLEEVTRLRINPKGFLEAFYGDPKAFAKAVAQLNEALARERLEVEALGTALDGVAQQQGVLSRQQLGELGRLDSRSPAGEQLAAFVEGQREQTYAGLLRAAEGLARAASLTDAEIAKLTEGITDDDERQRRIAEALRARATDVMERFGPSVTAAASGIFTAVNDAFQRGEALVSVLERLAPAIDTVRTLFERSGRTPGAGFQQVESYRRIATDRDAGPALEVGTGLGQALAGLTNSGLMSPELFGELANGIGAAYHQMELFGKGGLDAARLLQPALQTIWQQVEDFPGFEDQLDEDTRALLDFAEKSGLVGDKFRPAIDRMITKIGDLIQRFDEFLARLDRVGDADLPTPPGETPAGTPPGPGDPATADPPGLHIGTGGLQDFGAGRLVRLHGKEAVSTALEYNALKRAAARGLAGPDNLASLRALPSMAGLGAEQTILVQLDGRTLARSNVRNMPREWRMVGV